MTKRQFKALCNQLLPELPGFAWKGWLLYAQPIGHVLRGLCCEDSGFNPHAFALTVFCLPLYVPTKHLHFNMGYRLKDERGCDIWWGLNDEHLRERILDRIRQGGLPFLHEVREPSQVPAAVRRLPGPLDPYRLEAVAYSLVMTDDFASAQQGLHELVNALNAQIGWQAEMLERAKQLASTLSMDPQSATQLLEEWEQVTLKNLGL